MDGAQLRQGQRAKVSKKRPIKLVIREKKETWDGWRVIAPGPANKTIENAACKISYP